MSNALVVSAAKSASGHPLAVFGPQTGYFAPEILMEEDVHGPGIDARGAAFPGTNVYVQLGRGRDYAWSATSAGSDIADTWALPLCDPSGGKPTTGSNYYLYKGQCQKLEVLTRTNSWTPNAADQTPPGSETLTAERTPLGVVTGRANVHGKPVIYVTDRTTYFHEVDSALGFKDMNDPGKVSSPRDFQHAMAKVGYAFNWFYVDNKHTAYFNSGADPVRNGALNPNFPAWGRPQYLWKNWNDQTKTEATIPASQHPQGIDQDYFTSWNNKQAPGFRAADQQWGYGPIYRSQMLDQQLVPQIAGGKKTTLAGVVNAMETAGTVDMRADFLLTIAFKLLGSQSDPKVAHALDELEAWHAAGSHRIDRDRNGVYENSDAIRIMDAWWPLWVKAEFQPALGSDLFGKIQAILSIDNPPNNNGDHLGVGLPGRLVGLRVEGPAAHPRDAGEGHVLPRLLRPRLARQVPRGAARLAEEGDRHAGEQHLQGRHLLEGGQAGQPAVLRHDLVPSARGDHAAADRVGQPSHLPAGGGGAGPPLTDSG